MSVDQEAARVISGEDRGKEEEDTATCSLMLIITPLELQATGSGRGQKRMTGNGFDFHLFLNRINLKGKFREAT